MEIILLENVRKLGVMGQVVEVRNGYAKNKLIPCGLAVRATKANLALFEEQKAERMRLYQEAHAAAAALAEKTSGLSINIVRQAGDDGRLYGAVSARDVAKVASEKLGFDIKAEMVSFNNRLREIGSYDINLQLHHEVNVSITVNIVRNEEA